MEKIKVWFTGKDVKSAQTNPFYKLLKYDFIPILDEKCDYIFVDYKDYVYTKTYLKHDCVRIFYSTENIFPDYTLIDYAICPNFCPNEDRFLWLPYYWWDKSSWNLLSNLTINDWASRDKFCCFIVSNNNAEPMLSCPKMAMREFMFEELSRYKPVDSPGRFKNNCSPIPVDPTTKDFYGAKIEFMSKYRFALVFENSRSPGYTTEKIVHAYLAGCIPIYWGDPKITDQFDEGSFIWVKDESDIKRAMEEIIETDQDPERYQRYFLHRKVYKDAFSKVCTNDYVRSFLKEIVERGPINSKKRSRYYLTQVYESRMSTKTLELTTEDQVVNVQKVLPFSTFTGHAHSIRVFSEDDSYFARLENEWKGYIVSAIGRFKYPPDPKMTDFPYIPEGAINVELKVRIDTKLPILFTPFFIQFDNEKELRTDFKDVSSVISKETTLNFPIVEGATSYKVAIRFMRDDRVAETFDVKLDLVSLTFNCIKKGFKNSA